LKQARRAWGCHAILSVSLASDPGVLAAPLQLDLQRQLKSILDRRGVIEFNKKGSQQGHWRSLLSAGCDALQQSGVALPLIVSVCRILLERVPLGFLQQELELKAPCGPIVECLALRRGTAFRVDISLLRRVVELRPALFWPLYHAGAPFVYSELTERFQDVHLLDQATEDRCKTLSHLLPPSDEMQSKSPKSRLTQLLSNFSSPADKLALACVCIGLSKEQLLSFKDERHNSLLHLICLSDRLRTRALVQECLPHSP
jgi:hypothetical protein